MPRKEQVRVRMTGTTVWTVRPGDEISIDAKMARRWERGKMAVIIDKPEEPAELTLSELRKICEYHNLAIRGTKAEVKQRILDSGIELKLPEEDLPFDEIEVVVGEPDTEPDGTYYGLPESD
jgi:hypothetical protein